MLCTRPANAADLARMKEIASHAATAAQWRESEYEKLFAPQMQQNGLALVVEEGGAVCGFIVARQVDYEWEIENIAVSGPARRRGLGTRLVGEFIDLARSRGAKTIYLEVRESNLAARMLYEKWAFVETGRRKGYYADPAEDALILAMSL
jgi:ribosomal-protein-alanine N-acetyltransferase